MVMVTLPDAGTLPVHDAVLAAVLAVPADAIAETSVRLAGSTSLNSLPALSGDAGVPPVAVTLTSVTPAGSVSVSSFPALSGEAAEPELLSVMVYVTVLPTPNVPLTVFVPLTFAFATRKTVGSLAPPTDGSSVALV